MSTLVPALRRRQSTPARRRIVLVDIENLIGGAVLTAHQVDWAKTQLVIAIGLVDRDQVVIGTSHIGLVTIGTRWERQRYVVRSGDDGADIALLEVLAEDLASRYDEVVLASGDGIFTDAAAALAAAGVDVHVVAPADALARRLSLAASRVTLLPNQYTISALGGAA
ncbi:NYN domain-containing protein [Nocardioides sp. cx-169]|uniref:NYN domain-containing protein n=1 Tax=Nocardioides sp. cx-169 TaxID=2899080 RepID=UPI001E51900E|nr:NYN domain-containing protein [Nocardioides sp. cx-169]MCD4532503.1 NYN domain-containing protein [Nocardioides sp. cx-169]